MMTEDVRGLVRTGRPGDLALTGTAAVLSEIPFMGEPKGDPFGCHKESISAAK